MRSGLVPILALSALAHGVMSSAPAAAQWIPNGTWYCIAPNDQLDPSICPADSFGAILVWADSRAGVFGFDIYAQRVDSEGRPRWGSNGVPVCTANADQVRPLIVSDGAGGAVIAWEDFRNVNDDIFVQRLDAAGNRMWLPADGVGLCVDPAQQTAISIASDGSGGAIVVWEDDRSGLAPDIYGQRINAAGAVQWMANGRGLCTAAEDQFEPDLIPDGAGGAILTWFDSRNFDFDIYAQRIDASGTGVWTADGVPVCTEFGTQRSPVIAPDSSGGAIIAWDDFRDTIPSFDIYVQRVNFAGARVWTNNGVALCSNGFDQVAPVIASDGAGGAFVAWEDQRASRPDIYARRVNSAGVPQWAANGVAVCSEIGSQQSPGIVRGPSGSAIVTWEDLRQSVFNTDLYAQRIGPSGSLLWTATGVPLTAAGTDQVAPSMIPDGAGGAITVWEDGRNGQNGDIYAQRVDSTGQIAPSTLDVPAGRRLGFELSAAHPNPCRAGTTLRFAMPFPEAVSAEVLDVTGRRVRELVRADRLAAGVHTLGWDARDEQGAQVRGGVYWLRISTPDGYAARPVTVLP